MEQQEHLRKQSLAKERAFLFLSVLAAAVLLSSSPKSLLVFFSGTLNTVTGASIALEPIGIKDYFMGLAIFAALVAISFYIVHILRNPQPQLWKADFPQEKKESLKPLAGKYSLDTKLDQLNEEIKELRKKKEFPAPAKRPKKLTRVPNVKEEALENELRKLTARLQGYRKPTILEAPREKTKWDEHLEKVKTKIHDLDKMKFRKSKVLQRIPSKKNIALAVEAKKLDQEWEQQVKKRKPMILPSPQGKGKLSKDLEHIRKELAKVEKMEIAKVKIRETAPSMKEVAEAVEKKRLTRELKKVSAMLNTQPRLKGS